MKNPSIIHASDNDNRTLLHIAVLTNKLDVCLTAL